MRAVVADNIEIVTHLVEHGAQINVQTDQETALDRALQQRGKKLFKITRR